MLAQTHGRTYCWIFFVQRTDKFLDIHGHHMYVVLMNILQYHHWVAKTNNYIDICIKILSLIFNMAVLGKAFELSLSHCYR